MKPGFNTLASRTVLGGLIAVACAQAANAQVFELGPDGALTDVSRSALLGQTFAACPVPHARPPEAVREAIAGAAERYALSPQLLEAVASVESNYRQDAISAKGALGVMQLMPKTAERLGADPRDMNANILGGAAYLRQLIDAFDGDIDQALAAYNAGPRAVRRYGGTPPFNETRSYVAAGLDRLAADVAPLPPVPCGPGD